MGERILLVEDDTQIADIVDYNLRREGYTVQKAADGITGLRMALEDSPDLVLLDVMLPGMNGFDLLRSLRTKSNVPVIMLTAREEENDRITGFELGADDYVPKPFSFRELMLRVAANLRRNRPLSEEPEQPAEDPDNGLRLCTEHYSVFKDEGEIELTLREFELLRCLMEQPGRVFSREELLEKVWGYNFPGETLRMVDTAVNRLREKIENTPESRHYIETKRGVGYYYNTKIQ